MTDREMSEVDWLRAEAGSDGLYIVTLRKALQQDANLIHYGRHTKDRKSHSERFEDCTNVRCAERRLLIGPDPTLATDS